MELTQDQLAILSNFFDEQLNLPVVVAEIAAVIRNTISPENPASPIETEHGDEVIAPVEETPASVEETPAPVEETPAPAPVTE